MEVLPDNALHRSPFPAIHLIRKARKHVLSFFCTSVAACQADLEGGTVIEDARKQVNICIWSEGNEQSVTLKLTACFGRKRTPSEAEIAITSEDWSMSAKGKLAASDKL